MQFTTVSVLALASVVVADQVLTQIGDGQIQATTSASATVATQIGDGQIQATTTNGKKDSKPAETSPATPSGDYQGFPESCKNPDALSMHGFKQGYLD